jgi:hypothetical protein
MYVQKRENVVTFAPLFLKSFNQQKEMKKTFLIIPVNALQPEAGTGFFTVPERTVFLHMQVPFRVRR